MKTCSMPLILVWMMMMMMMNTASKDSVSGFPSIRAKLHQPATLRCERKCPAVMKWTRIQKPRSDVEVAQCNRTTCSSEEGFHVSYDEYLQGNLSLTITEVNYPRRGWYRSLCDGQEVCVISLRIESVELTKPIHPRDPLIFDIEVPERVKVKFNSSTDDGHNSVPVSLCTVEGRKMHCDPKYEKRVLFKCSLALSDVKKTDIGVYTVWDTDNKEVLSTLTLTGHHTDNNGTILVKGHHTDNNGTILVKGKDDSWDLQRLFKEEYRGIILGLILGVCACGALWGFLSCSYLIKRKMEECWKGDADHKKPDEPNSDESIKLKECDSDHVMN